MSGVGRRDVRVAAFAAVIAAGLVACGSDPIQYVPKNFDHPADLAFVCFNTETDEPVPLADCKGVNDDELSPLALHAVVTQRIRGELAVVDVRKRRLIDANTLVPGYTFIPVGELPNGVVIPEKDPEFTYVSNYGTQDIRVIPTKLLRRNLANAELATTVLSLGSGPGDLAISADGKTLYASLPDTGQVAEIAIKKEGALGAPTFVTLSATVTAPVPEAAPESEYCVSCPATDCEGLGKPTAPAVREPVTFGTTPHPVALFVDAETDRLFVADEALPVIHVLDISGAATETEGFATGTPVLDVTVTPAVPDTADGKPKDATTRFVYAIDATDGSVLALNDASGEILRVTDTPGRAPDRLNLTAAARSLAILAPAYEDGKGEVCKSTNRALADLVSPTHLRGVFLAVGTADGLTGIVDVYDLDAACRTCSESSGAAESAFYIRRHRPRIGTRIRQPASLFGTPSMVVNSLVFRPAADGSTPGELAPNLSQLECPVGQAQVFPPLDEGDSVICAATSPWSATSERWTATFEGAILGSRGGAGAVDADAGKPTVTVDVDLCAAGILGTDNVADLGDDEPESGYAGDVFEVVGDLPTSTEDDEACDKRFGTDAPDTNRLFPITFASAHKVELKAKAAAWKEVTRCFPDPFNYVVHSGDAFTVIGGRTGSLHRVVSETGSDACVVDTDLDPLRQFRAQYDRPFVNGHVAFEIARAQPENQEDTVLRRGDLGYFEFVTGNAPSALLVGVGTLPGKVQWSPIDDYLYVLDNSGRGFLRLVPDDMSIRPAAAFR